jgi:putative (di)nucleoside polyphosphate hydrolase
MLLNREGLAFVGRRKSEAGPEHVSAGYAWQMPQGGIDAGEDPYAAAVRELFEETSVRSVTLLPNRPTGTATTCPPWWPAGLEGPLPGTGPEVVRLPLHG